MAKWQIEATTSTSESVDRVAAMRRSRHALLAAGMHYGYCSTDAHACMHACIAVLLRLQILLESDSQ